MKSLHQKSHSNNTERVSVGFCDCGIFVKGAFKKTLSSNTPFDHDGVNNDEDDFPNDETQAAVEAIIRIESPINGFVTANNQVEIVGNVIGLFSQVTVDDTAAQIIDGEIRATISLHEGANKISAIGLYDTPRGERSETVTRTLVLDTIAPDIILSSVAEGMVTTETKITISGSLNDIRSNLSDVSEPTVAVMGTPVEVINRSFELAHFLLQPGVNVVDVVATDPAGNSRLLIRQVTAMYGF